MKMVSYVNDNDGPGTIDLLPNYKYRKLVEDEDAPEEASATELVFVPPKLQPQSSTASASSAVDVQTGSIVDKVITVGCFDLLHAGHKKLFRRMRGLGKRLVVGVHDSRRYIPLIFSIVFHCVRRLFSFTASIS